MLVSLPLVHRILTTFLPEMRDVPQVKLSRLDTDAPAGQMSPFLRKGRVVGKQNQNLFPKNFPGGKWIFVTCWPRREMVAEVPPLDLQDLEGTASAQGSAAGNTFSSPGSAHCTVFLVERPKSPKRACANSTEFLE